MKDKNIDTNSSSGSTDSESEPEQESNYASPLALGRLSLLDQPTARRYARKRGVSWPTTDELRTQLRDGIIDAIRGKERRFVVAPTSAGKTHTPATKQWRALPETTGHEPVIHLSPTRAARDEAIQKTKDSNATGIAMLGRKECCPVASGRHDPKADSDGDDPETVVTIGGKPASDWIDQKCDDVGIQLSNVHTRLERENDQEHETLPCSDGTKCPAAAQWKGVPREEETDEPAADVIHATHNFAYVPSLIRNANVLIDEIPDFREDISNDRIQRAVAAFLDQSFAPISTWEEFVEYAHSNEETPDRTLIEYCFTDLPDTDWYFEDPDAHMLAPGLAEGIWKALQNEADLNGRRSATVNYTLPQLTTDSQESPPSRVRINIVISSDNRIRTVRVAPDFSIARSVIGLDARPCAPLWQLNVLPDMSAKTLLDPDERRNWRRYERGLYTVQIGEATRPLSSGEYFHEQKSRALISQLRSEYGDDFSSVITAKSVKERVRNLMENYGVRDPSIMHYNNEKSRNDFKDEPVGLILGCIDPGDDYVLDLLAELGLSATPERSDSSCTICNGDGCRQCNQTGQKRAHGREFVGEDADTAAALLESVREDHVVQGTGRYARNPDDPDDKALVFIHTDAVPPGFVDFQVPDVTPLSTDIQKQIIKELQSRPEATSKVLADAIGCTKQSVRINLTKFKLYDIVEVREGAGYQGADLYRILTEEPVEGLVDLDIGELAREIANGDVEDSFTYSLVVDTEDRFPNEHRSPNDGVTDSNSRMNGSEVGVFEPG